MRLQVLNIDVFAPEKQCAFLAGVLERDVLAPPMPEEREDYSAILVPYGIPVENYADIIRRSFGQENCFCKSLTKEIAGEWASKIKLLWAQPQEFRFERIRFVAPHPSIFNQQNDSLAAHIGALMAMCYMEDKRGYTEFVIPGARIKVADEWLIPHAFITQGKFIFKATRESVLLESKTIAIPQLFLPNG